MKSYLQQLGALTFLVLSYTVQANSGVPELVSSAVPGAAKVGEARYSYLFWDVYDARLFAPQGKWQPQESFALALTYLRDFAGEDIAERSIKEMREQGLSDKSRIERWQSAMQQIFPDVKEQDTITGIKTSAGVTRFFHNDELVGEVEDPAFGEWFFNIWLGPQTTEPEFRAKLLELEE